MHDKYPDEFWVPGSLCLCTLTLVKFFLFSGPQSLFFSFKYGYLCGLAQPENILGGGSQVKH